MNRLKYINLSNNLLTENIPDGPEWAEFTQLEMIELQNNKLQKTIPVYWMYLTELTYVNLSNNQLQGSIPIWTNA